MFYLFIYSHGVASCRARVWLMNKLLMPRKEHQTTLFEHPSDFFAQIDVVAAVAASNYLPDWYVCRVSVFRLPWVSVVIVHLRAYQVCLCYFLSHISLFLFIFISFPPHMSGGPSVSTGFLFFHNVMISRVMKCSRVFPRIFRPQLRMLCGNGGLGCHCFRTSVNLLKWS